MIKKEIKVANYVELYDFFKDLSDGYYRISTGENDAHRYFNNNKDSRRKLEHHFPEVIYTEDDVWFTVEETEPNVDFVHNRPQRFRNGPQNCLFSPIIKYCQDVIDNPVTQKKTREAHVTIRNKAKNMLVVYKDGVPQDQATFDEICEKLRVTIEVYPVKKLMDKTESCIIRSSPKNKSYLNFKFYNTGIDHVEYIGGLVFETDYIPPKDTGFYIEKRYAEKVTELVTKDGVVKLRNTKKDAFNAFEEETQMTFFKIDSVKYADLSLFIFSGVHCGQTYDFKKIIRDDPFGDLYNSPCNDRPESIDENDPSIKSVDQIKAYANTHDCEYYEGFPAKITDFRRTNKIVEIGYYEIRNLQAPKLFEDLGFDNGVYTSAMLKFMTANGCTYDIFQGCWGTRFDFKYPDYMMEKVDGIRLYSLHAGCSTISSDKSYYRCSKELATVVEKSFRDRESCVFEVPKACNRHLAHVYGFVYDYVTIKTITMIQKIISTNGYSSLVRVCKDGIYYTGPDVQASGWSEKNDIKLKNYGSSLVYVSPSFIEVLGEYKDFYKNNGLFGGGGTGKTYTVATDPGNINMCYIVVSYKLLSRQLTDYKNLRGCVLANYQAKTSDEDKKVYRNASILLFDECSMLTERTKNEIINSFKYHKIYFIGDPSCQLPPYSEESEKSMTSKNLQIQYFSRYYRFGGKLAEIQPKFRTLISVEDNKIDFMNFLRQFNRISLTELVRKYKREDIILVYRNITADTYTNMFKHLEKYQITRKNKNYYRGDIVYQSPDAPHELRHGYTTHSIQGETFRDNIYIDYMDIARSQEYDFKRLIYTAVTRAICFENVYFIEY